MLKGSPDLDLIFILSPSELHVQQALLCLQYDKHVFIEKPLANTLAEVDQLLAAEAEAQRRAEERGTKGKGPVVFVGYMRRYAAGIDHVKERIKGKKIQYVRVRELIGSVSLFIPCPHALDCKAARTQAGRGKRASWCSDTRSVQAKKEENRDGRPTQLSPPLKLC